LHWSRGLPCGQGQYQMTSEAGHPSKVVGYDCSISVDDGNLAMENALSVLMTHYADGRRSVAVSLRRWCLETVAGLDEKGLRTWNDRCGSCVSNDGCSCQGNEASDLGESRPCGFRWDGTLFAQGSRLEGGCHPAGSSSPVACPVLLCQGCKAACSAGEIAMHRVGDLDLDGPEHETAVLAILARNVVGQGSDPAHGGEQVDRENSLG